MELSLKYSVYGNKLTSLYTLSVSEFVFTSQAYAS